MPDPREIRLRLLHREHPAPVLDLLRAAVTGDPQARALCFSPDLTATAVLLWRIEEQLRRMNR